MSIRVEVFARDKNTFMAEVIAGQSYRVSAEGCWIDWRIRTDARGFQSPFYLKPFERFRRLPEANWFALVGFIAPKPLASRDQISPPDFALFDMSPYVDGASRWTCPNSGCLHVFANDVSTAYRNNKGSISLSFANEV